MNYLVIETQTSLAGNTIVAPVFTTDDINQAYARLHSILAAAATSDVHKHSAWICDETGSFVSGQTFTH